VRPAAAVRETPAEQAPPQEESKPKGGGGGGDFGELDPFILGCCALCPSLAPNGRSPREPKWLLTAANIFDLIYKGDGGSRSRLRWPNDRHDLMTTNERRPPTEAASLDSDLWRLVGVTKNVLAL
jgi:hypothetical protein